MALSRPVSVALYPPPHGASPPLALCLAWRGAEREPKKHRGNPKGYQIKPFCKNPACAKPLPGGRCNKCPHCLFDLASHRKEVQLEKLLKNGPLQPAAARNMLRDTANEVHVRTGGKAVIVTLVYVEGGHPAAAPAQAIGAFAGVCQGADEGGRLAA